MWNAKGNGDVEATNAVFRPRPLGAERKGEWPPADAACSANRKAGLAPPPRAGKVARPLLESKGVGVSLGVTDASLSCS